MAYINNLTPEEKHNHGPTKFRAWVNKLIELWQQELAESRETKREQTMANWLCENLADELAQGIYDNIEEIKKVRTRNKGEWRDDIII